MLLCSFPIKDSFKLLQIYNKREQLLKKKISIPPVFQNTNNIYGYIDIGFLLITSNIQNAIDTFNQADLKAIADETISNISSSSLYNIGNSIIFTPGGLSTTQGHLPAHTNNFIEIMADGSSRMRVLLINNDENNSSVNMMLPATILHSYKEIYSKIMGNLFPHNIAYAKKYESLTVKRQFQPVMFYDKFALESNPEW